MLSEPSWKNIVKADAFRLKVNYILLKLNVKSFMGVNVTKNLVYENSVLYYMLNRMKATILPI